MKEENIDCVDSRKYHLNPLYIGVIKIVTYISYNEREKRKFYTLEISIKTQYPYQFAGLALTVLYMKEKKI